MKTSKIIALVAWLLIAVILTGVLAAVLVLDIDSVSFGVYGYTYDNADRYSYGDFSLSDKIKELSINWPRGKVLVEVYEGETVLVNETGAEGADMQLHWLMSGGELDIRYCRSKIYLGFTRQTAKTLTVKIPKSFIDGIESVDIECVSAGIELNGISADRLDIEQVSGTVVFGGVDFNVIDIEAVSSRLELEGRFGSIQINTVSGDTVVTDTVLPAEMDFESVSGDMDLTIADGDGFEAAFETVSGDFYSSFPTQLNGDRYVYSDGLARFDFETVSGDVNIKKYSGVQEG